MVPQKKLTFGQFKAFLVPMSRATWVLGVVILTPIIAWMPIYLSTIPAAGKSAATCTVGPEADERSSINVKSGEAFSVCLNLVPGAGQIWRIKVDEGTKIFQTVSEPTFETPIEQPGAEGYMRFVLRPTAVGAFNLVFQKFGPGRSTRELATVSLTIMVS